MSVGLPEAGSAAGTTEGVDEAFADIDGWPVARILSGLIDHQAQAIAAVRAAAPALEAALSGAGSEEDRARLLRAALRSSANAANSAFGKRGVGAVLSPGDAH